MTLSISPGGSKSIPRGGCDVVRIRSRNDLLPPAEEQADGRLEEDAGLKCLINLRDASGIHPSSQEVKTTASN